MKRLWFIDFFRGFAIVCMVIYHAFFDYYFLKGENFEHAFFAPFIGFLFIAASGFSIRAARIMKKNINLKRRFSVLFSVAMLISFATYIYDSGCFIKFGIIHFFAISALLIPFFPESKTIAFFAAIPLIISGAYFEINELHAKTKLLFPFGIAYYGFCSYDYYPLLPWLGFYILSFSFGDVFFRLAKELENRKPEKLKKVFDAITLAGKKSLELYLIHQPVLFAFLLLLGFLNKAAY